MGDAVEDACADLAEYFARLEALVPERAEDGIAVAGTRAHMAVSPEPGNATAMRALMTAHEGVRRLLASLRIRTAGHPGARFGGSDACTARVLALIPKAAAGLDDESRDATAWFLAKWINGARMVHGIDEVNPLRHLPKPRPGELMPPCCPYCGCYQLLADVEAQLVHCSVPDCKDGLGLPPVASMTVSSTGHSQLQWADGLVEAGLDVGD